MKTAAPLVDTGRDSFFGRQRELRLLRAAAVPGASIVVTGMGGVGKSRLVEECTRELDAPTWWLDLEGAATLHQLLFEASRGLACEPLADLDSLASELARRGRGIVVLDGFERLADGPTDIIGALRRAPELTLVVTSRVPLGLEAQRQLALSPLDPESSVALLRARAQRHDLAFEIHSDAEGTTRLLRCLDGLPLAIELAARMLRTLSAGQLADRLTAGRRVLKAPSSGSQRHSSVAAILESTVERLSGAELAAATRLVAVEGSFTIETAEALVADLDADALEALGTLRELGIVRRCSVDPASSFELLATVRRYLRGRMDPAAWQAAARAHAARFLERCAPLCTPTALIENLLAGGYRGPLIDDVVQLERVLERPEVPLERRMEAAFAVFGTLGHRHPTWRYEPVLSVAREAVRESAGRAGEAAGGLLLCHAAGVLLAPMPASDELVRWIEVAERWDGAAAAQLEYFLGRVAPSSVDPEEARRRAIARCGVVGLLWTHKDRLEGLSVLPRPLALDLVVRSQREARGFPLIARRWSFHQTSLLLELGRLAEAKASLDRATARCPPQPVDLVVATSLLSQLAFASGDESTGREHLDRARAIADESELPCPAWSLLVRTGCLVALADGRSDDVLDRIGSSPSSGGQPMARAQLRWMAGLAHLHARDVVSALAEVEERSPDATWTADDALVDGVRALAHAWRGDAAAARSSLAMACSRALCRGSRRVQAAISDVADLVARWLCVTREALHCRPAIPAPPFLVRRALEPLRALSPDAAPDALRVGTDLRWCEAPQSARLDLSRRPVLRRIVGELVTARLDRPGDVVEAERLIAAGWPDDRASSVSLRNRLWVALSRLRRAGFDRAIERIGSGYRIPAGFPVRRVS